jgi:hypothetical protein
LELRNPPSGGGKYFGQTCVSSWDCEEWGECIEDLQTRECTDSNFCLVSTDSPLIIQGCRDSELTEFPSTGGISTGGARTCTSNFECSEWTNCQAVYDLQDIIAERVLLTGEQQRKCVDKNNCDYDKTDRQECATKNSIYAQKVFKCGEEYIEIYDENDILISRMKLVDGAYQQLDVQMLFDEFGYCPYCYDSVKNYEEDEIDCQYSGEDCPVCAVEIPLLRANYPIMLISLIGLAGLSFVFIIWYFVLLRRGRKRVRRLLRLSNHKPHEHKVKTDFKVSRKSKKRLFKGLGILIGFIGLLTAGYYLFNLFVGKVAPLIKGLASLSLNYSYLGLIVLGILVIGIVVLIIMKLKRRKFDFSKILRRHHKKKRNKLVRLKKKIIKKRKKITKKQVKGKMSFKEKTSLARDVMIFEKGVERLKELREELKRVKNHKEEKGEIMRKMKNIGKIPEIERNIRGLKKK